MCGARKQTWEMPIEPAQAEPARPRHSILCKCCTSPHVSEIDSALNSGLGQNEVARVYQLPPDSVHRHARRHLARHIEARTPFNREEQIRRWLDRCEFLYEAAGKRRDVGRQLQTISTALRVLELDMRRSGELKGDTNVQVNVAVRQHREISDAEMVAEMKDLIQVLEGREPALESKPAALPALPTGYVAEEKVSNE
jgi:hypothetical protein